MPYSWSSANAPLQALCCRPHPRAEEKLKQAPGSLLLPNRAVHILNSLYRNLLLLPYLATGAFGHCTAVQDRQFALKRLFAARFEIDPGRYIVARNELAVFAV